MKTKHTRRLIQVSLIFGFLLLPNCHRVITLPSPPAIPAKPPSPLIRLSLPDYPRFTDDGDRDELCRALSLQINYFARLKNPAEYSFGNTTISAEKIRATLEAFLTMLTENADDDLTRLIKENFDLYQSSGANGTGTVTFTGYYLPEVEGSLTPSREYRYPLYRPPDDFLLLETQPGGEKKAVRIENGKQVPYYTRKQIDEDGVLRGKGCEIVFLKDPFDAYLLHIQGSGTVRLPDGRRLAVHFAGSNYLSYLSLGEEMIRDGIIDRHQASMDSIRSYFAEHPDKLQSYFNRNERYTFFSIKTAEASGSLGVPLTPGRSIASDRQIFPAGALSYIATAVPSPPTAVSGAAIPWTGFVLNQDEGGAIKGANRVDIFWGTGTEAEYMASRMKHPGRLYYLLLKDGNER
jgi:membrane-bound lytic murein transglycosylase A